MLAYSVIILFVITGLLVYLEPFLGRFKRPIYVAIGVLLVIMAATKEVGIDPDSDTYEEMFNDAIYGREVLVEWSYILISQIVGLFSADVHFVFLIYAILGVTLKFIAFRQLSEQWFLPVLFYLSYFYVFHDCMQIRTGVLSGLFLLAIKPICEGQRLKAFLLLAIGFFFHYSAILLLPFLFVSNKEMSIVSRTKWALIIPFGYIFYFYGLSALLSMSVNIPYIGEKLAIYQTGTEKGILSASVNVFSPLFIFTSLLYLYILYFHDTIMEHDKHFPLLIKIFGVAIFSYIALSVFPVLAQRVNLLMRIVNIILFADIVYTVKPKWAAIAITLLIAFVYLNYAMPSIDFAIFWHQE